MFRQVYRQESRLHVMIQTGRLSLGSPITHLGCGHFRLPERKGRAGRIDEHAELPHIWNFGDVGEARGAKGFGLLSRGRNVVHQDVGHLLRQRVRHGALHHASPSPLSHFDDGIVHVRHIFELPVKQFLVELLCSLWVLRMQLNMHEWICHGFPPFQTRSIPTTFSNTSCRSASLGRP